MHMGAVILKYRGMARAETKKNERPSLLLP